MTVARSSIDPGTAMIGAVVRHTIPSSAVHRAMIAVEIPLVADRHSTIGGAGATEMIAVNQDHAAGRRMVSGVAADHAMTVEGQRHAEDRHTATGAAGDPATTDVDHHGETIAVDREVPNVEMVLAALIGAMGAAVVSTASCGG